MWNLKNRYKLTYLKNIKRLTNTENKLVVIKREREAGWSEEDKVEV